MKLLVSGQQIEKELIRLITNSKSFSWGVAWASVHSKSHGVLIKNKDKIKKIMVGIHFYQTHPEFLVDFIGFPKVRIIKKPSGVFHPKIYLFLKSKGYWEAIIGSPNFTKSAFSLNEEAAILLSNNDQNADKVKDGIDKLLDSYWKESNKITTEFVIKYKRVWEQKKPIVDRLSGEYGGLKRKNTASELDADIFTMSWEEYFHNVKHNKHDSFHDRIAVLNAARAIFRQYGKFADMPETARSAVAGFVETEDLNWKWFGNMRGSGIFMRKIQRNDKFISAALNSVPIEGRITKRDYLKYITRYLDTFKSANYRNPLATASRLIALKRPDYFVCLDSQNKSAFCRDFKIPISKLTVNNYWDEVVCRIMDCPWWNEPKPENEEEKAAWKGRAAMLDSIYYERT